ncbi:MAG TPA: hypothetical protein VIM62_00575 [Acidobacteriaceae bacterium]
MLPAKRSLFVCLLVSALSVAASAQGFHLSNNTSVSHGYAPGGHIPAALLSAKTIFLSNAGADSGLFPQPFSGDPNRGYEELYEMLKSAGQHQLVEDPSQADLVLELQLVAPSGPAGADKQKGAADPLPMFRLTIYDRKTHYILWAFTETIEVALRQQTHDKNFDQALSNIAYDFNAVTTSMSRNSQ